jgi:hypothetical protein
MSDRQFDELLKETLEEYGEPGATPREAMWRAVSESRRKVVTLPWWRRPMTRVDFLAGAVAAAVLILVGIWVGRLSQAPTDPAGPAVPQFRAEANPAPAGSLDSDDRMIPDGNDPGRMADGHAPAPRGAAPPSPRATAPPPADAMASASGGPEGGDATVSMGSDGEVEIGMRSQPGDANREVLRLVATRYLSRTESFLTRWRAGDPASTSGEWTRDWARRGLSDVRLLLDTTGQDDPEMKSLLLDLEVVLAQILQASADDSSLDRDLATRRLNDRAVLPRLRNMIPAGPEAAASQGVPR